MIAVGLAMLVFGFFILFLAGTFSAIEGESTFMNWTALISFLVAAFGLVLMLSGIVVWLWRVAP